MQNGVVDLAVRVLDLEGHHVKDMRALTVIGDHALDVRQPGASITGHGRGPGVAPAVTVHQAITGAEDSLTGGVSQTDQRPRTLLLAVLIKTGGGFDFRALTVNRSAADVPEDGVERSPADLAALLHVKVGVIIL